MRHAVIDRLDAIVISVDDNALPYYDFIFSISVKMEIAFPTEIIQTIKARI